MFCVHDGGKFFFFFNKLFVGNINNIFHLLGMMSLVREICHESINRIRHTAGSH